MNKTLKLVAVVIIIALLILAIWYLAAMDNNRNEIDIISEYPEKIIYTTDQEADVTKLQADCRQRNGTFNECGDICSPQAEACAEVCAFTCELPNADQNTSANAENLISYQTYQSSELQLGISIPLKTEITKLDNGLRFLFSGTGQMSETDFNDGFIITFLQSTSTITSTSALRLYAKNKADEAEKVGEISEAIQQTSFNDLPAYVFSTKANGQVRHIFVLHNNRILEIAYQSSDLSNNNYEKMLDTILKSVKFN